MGITYNNGGDNTIRVYCDAAYLVHENCKRRSGMVVYLNGGVVDTHSSKQKLVVISSSEAELASLCNGAQGILYYIELMKCHDEIPGKYILMENNESTITMVSNNIPSNHGSKHIQVRYYFIQQHIDDGKLSLEYCNTKDMIADLMTKPLIGTDFYNLRDN